jgi:hypothetical protein
MRDDLLEIFCAEYTKHFNALRAAQDSARKTRIAEKTRLERERENVLRAIREGMEARLVKGRSGAYHCPSRGAGHRYGGR